MIAPKRVSAGQPFKPSAAGWNAMSDFIRQHQAGATGGGLPRLPGVDPALTLLVRNDTGGALPVRSVLKLGDSIISLVDQPHQVQAQPYFEGTAPAGTTDLIVITLEPIAVGAVGRAVLTGVALVEVSVSNTSHTHASSSASVTARLASGTSGPARIIQKESGTGNKRAAVALGGGGSGGSGAAGDNRIVVGVLNSALPYHPLLGPLSAPMTVWEGLVPTATIVNVFDWSSGPRPAGARVVAAWDNESSRYWVVEAQGATLYRGVLDQTLTAGGSAMMSIWGSIVGNPNDTDTGIDVPVYGWLLTTGEYIQAGKRVIATLDPLNGLYYVTGAQC